MHQNKKKKRIIQINNQYASLSFSQESLDKFFEILDSLSFCSIPNGEVSIAFLGDDSIATLHADFLDDPTPTDVITFPGDPDMDFAGEICTSVDHAIDRSKELNNPFKKELSLYLVHGWLHLAGYNDKAENERKEMRLAESQALSELEKAGAIPDFSIS